MPSQVEDRTLEASTHLGQLLAWACWLLFSEPLSFQNRFVQAGSTCFCLEHTRFHFDDLAAMADITCRDRRGKSNRRPACELGPQRSVQRKAIRENIKESDRGRPREKGENEVAGLNKLYQHTN